VAPSLAKLAYSRRMASRIETMGDLWVYWRFQGLDDVSRVCDPGLGGLCPSAPVASPRGAKAKVDVLVREGQVRAEGLVRHFFPGGGLGLKFTAITDRDCPRRHPAVCSEDPFISSALSEAQHMPLAAVEVKDVDDNIGPAI
jgi:hypothetical protein